MKFVLKQTPNREKSIYKTLYIKLFLVKQIEAIASTNDTSFNNVVISMLESCLQDESLC